MALLLYCYASFLRSVIKRNTVLIMKIFMPAIKNPIDTINGKFCDLKSLAVKAIITAPTNNTVQAIHFNTSAAFPSLFITQNPYRYRFFA